MLDQVSGLESLRIDLLAHLHRIAAIDKDRGSTLQRHGHAPRAGKARQPCQTFGASRHIFALILIGARDDETGEPLMRQFLPQGLQSCFALRSVGLAVELLKPRHDPPVMIGQL